MSVKAIKWAMTLGPVDMTPMQRCVLFVLAYHHNHSSGLCCPSMETIAAECGTVDRVARKAVRGLEHIGVVKSRKRASDQGQTSNQYVLFGTVKNKSGRNLGSSPGRNHTTARPGRTLSSDERGIYSKAKVLRVVGGTSHE